MLHTGIFPKKLKIAKVILLYKNKDDTHITNDRPISILPSISKISEKVIYIQLYDYFTDIPCRVGSVGSVSASRTVGHEFASRPGHTKDHHKNGANCLSA